MNESERSLKRGLEDTYANYGLESPLQAPDTQNNVFALHQNHFQDLKHELTPTASSTYQRESSIARSSTGSLSDVGTSTPPGAPCSPVAAFSMLDGDAQPPKKRVKLTFAEQEAKRIEKQFKDAERARERERKEIERQQRDADKAKRDADRDAERRERQDDRRKKEAEKEEKRLKRDADKAEKEKERKSKEDEKRRKEEEKQRVEEEKRKKESKQAKLNSFFVAKTAQKDASPSPSLVDYATPSKSPSKSATTCEYERRFPSYFIQNNVKLAPASRFEHENWGLSNPEEAIDEYIGGEVKFERTPDLDPSTLFNCPDLVLYPRGKQVLPVKTVMTQMVGGAGRPIDLTTDSQNTQIKRSRMLLCKVPYKVITFQEDTRPSYKGTLTSQPLSKLRKLARNPTGRELSELNYDYDSEAEWIDEVEDGEDIDSDDDSDEDGVDGEEDLDGFLDDAEDVTAQAKKLVLHGELEVKSTGLCWEDKKRRGPVLEMYRYHMEIIHENIDGKTPIDPFSTHYWTPPVPAIIQGLMDPPRKPLNAMKDTSSSVNGSNKTKKMFGLSDTAKGTCAMIAKKLVHPDDMETFRDEVNGSDLSKVGLIEVLHKKLAKSSKAAIKATLELNAKRVGAKEADKRWIMNNEGTS